MLLLYLFIMLAIRSFFLNLHSTMLLLYRLRTFRSNRAFYIYIPLCFYFIDEDGILLRYPAEFTFHYASTLSFSAYWFAVLGFFIYIPLCFYFIRAWVDYSGKFETNLHSTMLLLYPYTNFIRSRVFSIYIPLCFYFIKKRRN